MNSKRIVALAGGVGGAKMALGLYKHLQSTDEAQNLSVIVNTGDDMEYLGLYISPDLDTVMYTLAGIANPAQGWGIAGDTANALAMLGDYGNDNWFWLGDRDIATHLRRTSLLSDGTTLTHATNMLCKALGITCDVLPMSDDPVRTMVQTVEAGELEFQHYFVHRRAADTVTGLYFKGIESARPTPQVVAALENPATVIFCPSNPYLSIQPILDLPAMRALLQKVAAPKIIVSPIVGGQALKGPAARLMQTLGGENNASALGVARIYAGLADCFVLDKQDTTQEEAIAALGYRVLLTDTIMKTDADKIRLAREILKWNKIA
jgi:LPPG:FO 2-phospho-L-lactate transferase